MECRDDHDLSKVSMVSLGPAHSHLLQTANPGWLLGWPGVGHPQGELCISVIQLAGSRSPGDHRVGRLVGALRYLPKIDGAIDLPENR
jgi:hypothetical protein